MKKFTLQILILIILTGTLIPIVSVYARPFIVGVDCKNFRVETQEYVDCANAVRNEPTPSTSGTSTTSNSSTTLPSTPVTGCPLGQTLGLDNRCVDLSKDYALLAPLPGVGPGFNPEEPGALGKYLNVMIKLIIGISAVLAMMMFVVGGIEYMSSELISSKEAGRSRMTNAVLGLILALGAWALLYTINPDLLNTEVQLENATLTVNLQDLGGEATNVPFVAINRATLQSRGIDCTGSGGKSAAPAIGQQFIGKTSYSQTARNTTTPSTIYVDCSSFVAQVYNCAGLPSPGGTTAAMFSPGSSTRIVGKDFDYDGNLNPGDLIGWREGDNGSGQKVETDGHVMIYLGNGKVLHSSSTYGGVTVSDLSSYQSRVTYMKRP